MLKAHIIWSTVDKICKYNNYIILQINSPVYSSNLSAFD